ncbi:MAG: hypothetical protein IKS10_03530 [Lachnospiraceae bacterium]|nr:hypothetical protein [Lachnospiraceae bacterium]
MKKFKAGITLAALSLAAVTALSGCKIVSPSDETKPVGSDATSSSTSTKPGDTNPGQTSAPQGSTAVSVTMPAKGAYTFAATDTSLFIYCDGTLESLETDSKFDKAYYNVDEFKQDMITPIINKYTATTSSKTAVTLAQCDLKDTTLSLKFKYETTEDYLKFNKSFNEYFENWELFVVCKVSDIGDFNTDIVGAFVDTEGNAVSSTKIKESCKDYYVCAVNFNGKLPDGVSGQFFFEGNVYYVSNGLKIEDKNSVKLYESSDVQYVIFY